ncbi:MAG TPA: sigma-70 family RNA polymerase sigma factor [Verrucomicrobiae bacterium]|nr:sigma-70 family RNA polymerase sigma factor [Verrucomicrobiae bacterium]
MNEQELYNLLKKAQAGDRNSFGLIYDHFKEKIFRFIFFRVGHKELAEDILADTFVKAWLKIQDVNSPKALSSWIYQVAKNNIIDYYRIKKAATVPIEEVSEILTDSVDPIDSTNLKIEHSKLLELIKHLTSEQQLVIQYKFFEDLTNEEIAGIMNKTEVSIRVIQHRAIIKLKQLSKRKLNKS